MSEQVTIRFPHIDAAGVMFYSRYFELLARWFDDSPLWQTPVAMLTRFIRPNRLGDRISIEFNSHGEQWSYSGRMGDKEHFRVASLAVVPLHRRPARFVIKAENVGGWACGPDGRMHISRCFEFFHVATEKFLESMIGLSYHEIHMKRKIGTPTAQFTTRISELPRMGDSMSSSVQLIAIGTKSMTLRHQLLRGEDCLAENEQVIVFVAMRRGDFQSIHIPGDVREELEKLFNVAA